MRGKRGSGESDVGQRSVGCRSKTVLEDLPVLLQRCVSGVLVKTPLCGFESECLLALQVRADVRDQLGDARENGF